jgi:hypothetical protein
VEHTNYAARLRYLDADAVDDSVVDYDGLDVVGPDGEKLGDLDGFIVDAEAGRVYYVVIDTAGWFRTKQLLLPIGHATLDEGGKALRVDIPRESLSRYPEFQESRFTEFNDDDLRLFESRTVEACCPDDQAAGASSDAWAYDSRRHYSQPNWWRDQSAVRERYRPLGATAATGAAAAVAGRHDREHVVARDSARDADDVPARAREADDLSPHLGGRAQPGDVLGIETGGERTHVGEGSEDENKRRRDAERAAKEQRESKG